MEGSRNPIRTDKVAALRKTDLFGSLTADLLQEVAGHAIVRHLGRGQLLFSEHDEASALYVVARGEIRSIRQSADGREQVLSTEKPGAVLAAVPVFNGGKFYSTTIADCPAEVLSIEKKDVHELCSQHTELLWNLARVLAHKVRHYADLVEMLALRNVEQRVAQYLLIAAQERGVRAGEGCVLELTLTRPEIASRLGSAREVVSRALTHLQQCELIQMQGRRLINVSNLRALGEFAGTEYPLEEKKMVSGLSSELA